MQQRISRFLGRLAMAVCTLPASFYHYGGVRPWLRATRRGTAFFLEVLSHPELSLAKVASKPRPIRLMVSLPLAAARQLRNNGGTLPSWHKVRGVLKREGWRGMRHRLSVPMPPAGLVVASGEPDDRRILVVDVRVPMPSISAADLAAFGLLEDLAAIGFDVTFLPCGLGGAPRDRAALEAMGITVISEGKGIDSAAAYVARFGKDFSAFYLIGTDAAEMLLETIRIVAPRARVLFHAPDVAFLREQREAELFGDEALRRKAELTRVRETAVMRAADHVVVVSSTEAPMLRSAGVFTPSSVFPALYAPVADRPQGFAGRRHLFFLGSFNHAPNLDAVRWFVGEVWPIVHAELPEAEFHIIGAFMPREITALEGSDGIKVDGFVEDLGPVLDGMRLSVAPLRYGAGIKGKVAVAMGAGVPCVCTSIAAEGTGIQDGEQVLIADAAADFARAVIRLYADAALWEDLAENGRQFVEQNFGRRANRASLLATLSKAGVLPADLFLEYAETRRVHFPVAKPSEARVSIILPVTRDDGRAVVATLAALAASRADGRWPAEVLLVGASGDMAVEEADIQHIDVPESSTFTERCELGVRRATADFCLIMRPGICLLPGALEEMCRTLESLPDVCAVGPKQLGRHGRIRQAGGVMLASGRIIFLGEDQERHAALHDIPGELDYLSSEVIMVRRGPWLQWQAGIADMGVHGAVAQRPGYRLFYQPRAEVVVPEAGTDGSGEPASCAFPGAIDATDGYLPEGTSLELAVSHADRMPTPAMRERAARGQFNILYFSPFPSHPDSHGNRATIKQFAEAFQRMGHRVHFVLLRDSGYGVQDELDMREAWDSLDILQDLAWGTMTPAGISFDGWYAPGQGEAIRRLCERYDIDVVFCSYIFQSKMLEMVPERILKVIDTHDKMGNRFEMFRSRGQPVEFFSCAPEEEGTYLRRADIVVARREEEARYFNEVSGVESAIVVPHIEAPRFLDRPFAALGSVGAVASANRVNLFLMRDLLASIDARLQGRQCPFSVHIAGEVRNMVKELSASDRALFESPWVRLHGFVDDIADFYRSVDVVVSPVTMGTGINVKTVQAMAYGMPLLTTAWGSKGIETGHPMHMHEDIDALVAALLDLAETPLGLEELAQVSRRRYEQFYEQGARSLRGLFLHPKLALAEQEGTGLLDSKADLPPIH